MSAQGFINLFDGKQTPSKDETNYLKKQQEEPLPSLPAPKRGRIKTSFGPAFEDMSVELLIHMNRGKP